MPDALVPLAVAEFEVFGATDADVAAYLLAIWGQPLEVVRAIAHQDVPGVAISGRRAWPR